MHSDMLNNTEASLLTVLHWINLNSVLKSYSSGELQLGSLTIYYFSIYNLHNKLMSLGVQSEPQFLDYGSSAWEIMHKTAVLEVPP